MAREDERIWTRDWVCVGVEAQIPAPGDLLPATVGDHGLHVQRQNDGSLRAAFNILQQGSCWTVPAQCGHGHKTQCPYVSCAHSLDTDALLAEAGQPTKAMRQFIGFNPLKLFAVPLECLGPLVFLSLALDGPPPLAEQVGPLAGAVGACRLGRLWHIDRFWAELDCDWSRATDALFAALGAAGSAGFEEEVAAPPELAADGRARLWRAFPNVVLAALPDHVAVLVIKPIRLDGVAVVTALFADDPGAQGSEGEEAAAARLAGWRSLLDAAWARSRALGAEDGSPIVAWARERREALPNDRHRASARR
jgi:hypothetical protein